MTEVANAVPLEALELQTAELAQHGAQLDDADYAFRLQLQEALKVSAGGYEVECVSVSDQSQSDEQLAHHKLQAAAFQQATVCAIDAQQARDMQTEFLRAANLQAHDQQVAHWLDTVEEDVWDKHGDNLQQPLDEDRLQDKVSQGTLVFSGHAHNDVVGYAAVLFNGTGLTIWEGCEAEVSEGPAYIVAAHLQACEMGLQAARHLGLQKIRVAAPDNHATLQALRPGSACSSQLAPYVEAISQLQASFPVISVVRGTLAETMPVQQKAAVKCMQTNVGNDDMHGNGHDDIQEDRDAETVDLTLTESCGICLEDVPQHDVHVIGGCLHRFCRSCLQSHAQGKLKEKCYPVPCPAPSCNTGISNAECTMILRSSQDRQMLAEVAAEASIPAAAKFYCPNPSCSALMISDEAGPNTHAECPACHKLMCMWCRTAWHPGQTCGEAKASKTDDTSLLRLAEHRRWRQCQQCRHMIELAHGCNHMTCPCGAEFCYQCGASYQRRKQTCRCDLFDEQQLLAEEERVRQHAANRGVGPARHANPMFRTQMCRHHMRGHCRRGDACNFAHAWDEIRPRPDEYDPMDE